jgi:hypothetical protein
MRPVASGAIVSRRQESDGIQKTSHRDISVPSCHLKNPGLRRQGLAVSTDSKRLLG